MVPHTLLPLLLDQLFPVISGPEELPDVVDLLELRGGEFCASLQVDPTMVAASCRAGYLPMSEDFTGHQVLLVKCHDERCVLEPNDLHVSRSTRRRASGLTIRIDHDFDRCLDAIVGHHQERWLTDRLCDSLRALHRDPLEGVAMRSVEVYADDLLVAGELGYSCGGVYTSMSGFHARSGAGSVQLAALGVLLSRAGFRLWDLGMPIEYKLSLGARIYDRHAFLQLYRRAAVAGPTPALPGVASCEELVRGTA